MRPAVVGTIIGTAVGALLWACSVNRISDGYKCNTNDDCAIDRVCMQGYCVLGNRPADAREIDAAVCPAICGGTCNFQTAECTITGTGSGNIACPPGWNCTIICAQNGACGMISCTNAASCDIECTADMACLGITCGGTDCGVQCTGQRACGTIGCTSGDCTATCSGGGGSPACGNISCTSGDCNATCTGSGACGTVTCQTGRCTTNCSGGLAACGTVSCGAGRCDTTCVGSGSGSDSSCSAINCASSCRCNVSCNTTTNLCPASMMCPDNAPGSAYCTVNGSNGQRCSSSFAPQCQSC